MVTLDTLDGVFDAFGGPSGMSRATGIRDGHLRVMKARGSIPSGYWRQIVDGGLALGINGLTFEVLADLHTPDREKAAPQPERAA